MSITRFTLALSAPENGRYLVRRGVDMLALLRALAARRAPVTLTFGRSDQRIQTQLIGINPAFEELLFAPGHDRAALDQLLSAGSFGVETTMEAIRLLFIASHAEITLFRQEDALRARIPDVLARMQRRESIRIPAPQDKLSFCTVHSRSGTGGNAGAGRSAPHAAAQGDTRLRLIDISTGGLGLGLPDHDPAFAAGKNLPECSVELPGIGVMRCALHVVYTKEAQPGSREHRIGCRFVDLPALSREQVRRCGAHLEHVQLAAG